MNILSEDKVTETIIHSADDIYNSRTGEWLLVEGGNYTDLRKTICIWILNEDVYKIDRMFTQLLNIKEFRKNISAMVVGDFMNADNEIWLNDLLTEVANELKVPTTGRFAITHRKDKLTIPYGAMCELDEKLTIYL